MKLYYLKIDVNKIILAITLLIAQSDPKKKEVMIDLVMDFICD